MCILVFVCVSACSFVSACFCLQATSRPSDFVDNLEFVYVQSMQRVSVDNCLSGREYGYPGFGPSKCVFQDLIE